MFSGRFGSRDLTPKQKASLDTRMFEVGTTIAPHKPTEMRANDDAMRRMGLDPKKIRKDHAKEMAQGAQAGKDLAVERSNVNSYTLKISAQTFPFGGGLAPIRDLRPPEMNVDFVGTRATANILVAEQAKGDSSEADTQKARSELISGFYFNEQTNKEAPRETWTDEKDGLRRMEGHADYHKRNQEDSDTTVVPVLPYAVTPDGGNNWTIGTIEDDVMANKESWNNEIGKHLGSDEEFSEYIKPDQKHLTQKQVDAVYTLIRPHVDNRFKALINEFELNRQRVIPPVMNQPVLLKTFPGDVGEPAYHAMSADGFVETARNQEIIARLEYQAEQYPKDSEDYKALKDLVDNTLAKSTRPPGWSNYYSPGEHEYSNTLTDGEKMYNVNQWWDGGVPWSKSHVPENANQYDNWKDNQQEKQLHHGSWETNYWNTHYEPDMFASNEAVEYSMLGSKPALIQAIADEKGMDPSEVREKIDFGRGFEGYSSQPTGKGGAPWIGDIKLSKENEMTYRQAPLNTFDHPIASAARNDAFKDPAYDNWSATMLIARNKDEQKAEERYRKVHNQIRDIPAGQSVDHGIQELLMNNPRYRMALQMKFPRDWDKYGNKVEGGASNYVAPIKNTSGADNMESITRKDKLAGKYASLEEKYSRERFAALSKDNNLDNTDVGYSNRGGMF